MIPEKADQSFDTARYSLGVLQDEPVGAEECFWPSAKTFDEIRDAAEGLIERDDFL